MHKKGGYVASFFRIRRGCSTVSIWTTEDGFVIEDDGVGITNMKDLLTVAESGWDDSVKITQKPFGIGWLSALFAADWVCVSSNGSTLEGMTADRNARQTSSKRSVA